MIAALAAGASARSLHLGKAIAICQILAGLAYAALAGTPALAAAFLLFGLGSLFLGPLTVWAQTVRMRFIPAEMRGRVFGLLRTLMQSTLPIGAVLASPLLAGGGMRAAMLAVGALLVIPALAALAIGMLGQDRPAAPRAGEGEASLAPTSLANPSR